MYPACLQGDDIGNAANGTAWTPTYYTKVRQPRAGHGALAGRGGNM